MILNVGDRVGRLTLLRKVSGTWQCRCDCGKFVKRASSGLHEGTMCIECYRKVSPFRKGKRGL